MIDISRKTKTLRVAEAMARITMLPETMALVQGGKIPKGDPFETAKVAAALAAKETSRIVPYCHPLPLDFIGVDFVRGEDHIAVNVTVKAIHKTGVEMEALTAASVAALTIYDMLKFADATMEIAGVKLVRKRGGKTDFTETFDPPLRAAVLVMSDSVAAGKKEDESGALIVERLEREGVEVADYAVVADTIGDIRGMLTHYADEAKIDLVLTTGGTGLGPRDRTPEAMKQVIEYDIPGIAETARAYGQERMPYAMLSRGVAGVRGKTIIVNLPGSKGGVEESLDAVFKPLLHACAIVRGGGH